MTLVLDTHALVWLVHDPKRLGDSANRELSAPGAVVHASHVSMWEMAIKRRIGKPIGTDRPAAEWFDTYVAASGLRELAIDRTDLAAVETLPLHHGDPFDRLLVAQTRRLGARLVTTDGRISEYDVETLW